MTSLDDDGDAIKKVEQKPFPYVFESVEIFDEHDDTARVFEMMLTHCRVLGALDQSDQSFSQSL